jgi:hypothetical protein
MIAIILVFYFTQLMGASAMPATMRENVYETNDSVDLGRNPIGLGNLSVTLTVGGAA